MKKLLFLAIILTGCGKANPTELTRPDSVIILKSNVQQNLKKNDSLQAKKDSIPTVRTVPERDTFWANLKRNLF